MGGTGGVIALDRQGNYCMVFNTEGMYRGVRQMGKEPEVLIYK
jgi:beta-aspartyl-peptidase (threonine type)